METVLFSNNCPKCNILKNKLNDNNIEFETSNDFNEIIEKGFKTLPILKYNGKYMDFMESIIFIKNKIGG